MKKRLSLLFFLLLVVTSCSNEGKEAISINDKEEEPQEKLTPLEEVSKVCFDSSIEDCSEIYIDNVDQIEDFPKEILDNYIGIYETIGAEHDIHYKKFVLEDNMKYLSSKGYQSIIKNNKEIGNTYYVKLIEEKIEPLSSLYNTNQIDIGMDAIELIISMGFPNDINRTTTQNTVNDQWVYNNKDIYVYLENGLVTSYQE